MATGDQVPKFTPDSPENNFTPESVMDTMEELIRRLPDIVARLNADSPDGRTIREGLSKKNFSREELSRLTNLFRHLPQYLSQGIDRAVSMVNSHK